MAIEFYADGVRDLAGGKVDVWAFDTESNGDCLYHIVLDDQRGPTDTPPYPGLFWGDLIIEYEGEDVFEDQIVVEFGGADDYDETIDRCILDEIEGSIGDMPSHLVDEIWGRSE